MNTPVVSDYSGHSPNTWIIFRSRGNKILIGAAVKENLGELGEDVSKLYWEAKEGFEWGGIISLW